MSVTFSYADRRPSLTKIKKLKLFITHVFQMEDQFLDDLTYVFCSDEYLLNINQQFLQHDYYTDIITFDLRNKKQDPVTGEIYISIDRVRDNALSHKTTVEQELLRVIFHGALHLCGFKDKKKSEITLMRYKEELYLRLYAEQLKSST